MDVWAIIPVKSLAEGKARLSHLLSAQERGQLMEELLRHVLSVVSQTPGIAQTLVVSSDPKVWQIAGDYGAMALEEGAPRDLNNAVAYAAREAAAGGAQAVLILPADLPLVRTADIRLMLAAGNENDAGLTNIIGRNSSCTAADLPLMAVCSDRYGGGTNALYLRPVGAFEFHYGPGSLQRHIKEAIELGFHVKLVNASGLQFDLDTEQDWQHHSSIENEKSFADYPIQQFSDQP